MTDPDPPEILATITPSPARVWLGLVVNGVLCFLLAWIVIFSPPEDALWTLFLVAAALYVGWTAYRGWTDRDVRIVLTTEGLSDSAGREICRFDDITRVNRGVFAFKPARGFALELSAPARRAWVPGLWWRLGRRVGVGGVTSAGATRLMAEIIESLLASRRG